MKLTYLVLYIFTVLFCACGRQTHSKSPKLNFREFNTTNLAYNSNIVDSLVRLAKDIDSQNLDTLISFERIPVKTIYQGKDNHQLITDYRYIDRINEFVPNKRIFIISDSVTLVLVNSFNNPINSFNKWKYEKWIFYNNKLKAIKFPNYAQYHIGGFKKKKIWKKNKRQIEGNIQSIKEGYKYKR